MRSDDTKIYSNYKKSKVSSMIAEDVLPDDLGGELNSAAEMLQNLVVKFSRDVKFDVKIKQKLAVAAQNLKDAQKNLYQGGGHDEDEIAVDNLADIPESPNYTTAQP